MLNPVELDAQRLESNSFLARFRKYGLPSARPGEIFRRF